jgi:hypothetical protein
VNEDFVDNFESYISRLNEIISSVQNMEETSMKSNPTFKREIMKLFLILKGIVGGLNSSKTYALFFDWFIPDKF